MQPIHARTTPLDTPHAALTRWVGGAVIAAAAWMTGPAVHAQELASPIVAHGYSFYGDLSYPSDFTHFSYVNPDAPVGGTISQHALGTFDSMNPYSIQGRPGRFSSVMYESLLEVVAPFNESAPADAYGEYYCLICESLEYPPTKDWVIFHMRPEARFSDGTPLTAHDVVFSHNLILEQGFPSYAQSVGRRVLSVEALDDYTVRFDFAPDISRRTLIDQVGYQSIWSQAWYERTGARLDESRLEVSPGSGPYVLDSFEINRRITYRRNPDYWGWHLPQNQGRHNFEVINIEYFGDDAAAFEAFKTGEYTMRAEGNSRQWATGYDFPAVDRGHVVREEIPVQTPPTPLGFVFNLQREDWQDRRVREAITLAYNFEWTNQSLQFGLMARRYSYSQGTRLEAMGVPEGEELAMLQSLGDIVAPEVLTEPVPTAPESRADALVDRRNMRRANRLLEEAGWIVGDDGVRRNAAGEVLRIEFPYSTASSETAQSIIESFSSNLTALGIEVLAQRIDPAQYTERTRNMDYDMLLSQYPAFLDTGSGLLQRFGSEFATEGIFNPAGLANPAIDQIIGISLDAPTPESRDNALRALDRLLRWELIMVPAWYAPTSWYAYWDVFRHPDVLPPLSDGVLDWWWYDADRAAELVEAGALR